MSDREKNGLRGRVATVKTEFLDWDQQTGEVSDRPQRATIEAYHPDGRIASLTYENPEGSVSTTTYLYNYRGDLVEVRSEFNGELHSSAVSHYDAGGRLAKTVNQSQDGTKWQAASYTYDAGGARTEVQFPLPDFVIAEMMANTRKAQLESGAPAGEVGYDVSLTATTTTRYDSNGNRLEELKHDKNHEVLGKTSYTYNELGRLIEKREEIGHISPFALLLNDPAVGPAEREALERAFEQLVQPGAELLVTTYSYDEQGRKIEEVTSRGPFGQLKQTFEYDEYGNLTVVRGIDESRTLRVGEGAAPAGETFDARRRHTYTHGYRHTYDAEGNWTERITTYRDESHDQPTRTAVERRAITYHPSER